MAKKVLAFICCIALLVGGIPVMAAPAAAAESASAVIRVSPEFIRAGDIVKVEVAIERVEDLYGVQFALTFDAGRLEPYGTFVSFPAGYQHIHDSSADLTCASCANGVTPVYPLIRGNQGDTSFKSEVVLAAFTFKALRAGRVQFGLQQLKAVSSEMYTNEHGRDDVKVIPVQNASPVAVVIRGSGSENSGPPGSRNAAPTLEDLRNESDPVKVAEGLLALLQASGVDDGSREEIERLAEASLARLFSAAPSEQTDIGGRSFGVLNPAELERNIRNGTELLQAALNSGLQPQAPDHVTIETGDAGDAGILLPPEALGSLASRGIDFVVKKDGAELRFPIAALSGAGDEGGVAVTIGRSGGQAATVAGGRLLPGAEYVFESYRIAGDRLESIRSFSPPVIAKVGYNPDGLDTEKVGYYWLNEATGEWEHIRAARHDAASASFTVPLDHFSRYAVMEFTRLYTDLDGLYAEAVRAIDVLSAQHLVSGVDADHFAPRREMTRAEFVVMLARLLDWEPVAYGGAFRDVRSEDWFAGAVEAASRRGVVQGYNGTFNPRAPITREEMAVMLMRAWPGDAVPASGSAERFDDDGRISGWARDAVYWAKAQGLIKGVGANRFDPKSNTRRAEMAVLFYNVLKSLNP